MKNHLFYLMGKSATGKDTLYEALLADETLALTPLIPWTTRPVRAKEQQGVEYYFTDESGLRALEQEGRVIEKRTYMTEHGPWTYCTVAEDAAPSSDRIGIGTLDSYRKIRDYYPDGYVVPIYVEVEDGIRLARALKRERKPGNHRYEEMCRRFLADQKDFSEEKLLRAGIVKRFHNDTDREICFAEVTEYIRMIQKESGTNRAIQADTGDTRTVQADSDTSQAGTGDTRSIPADSDTSRTMEHTDGSI